MAFFSRIEVRGLWLTVKSTQTNGRVFVQKTYARVLVLDGGQGVISECEIFNNYLGIEIRENSTPSVQHCTIKNNRHQGLVADGTSAGSITGSQLAGNSGGAWKIEDGSRLVRNGNTE